MIKSVFVAAALAVVLAGCGSSVKLDDVPVEDKSGSVVTQPPVAANPGAGSGSTTQTRVEPVNLNPAGDAAAGPTGVARVVYFDYDSFIIKPEFQSLIESHARFLKAASGRKIVVEGHTDERGGREYNLALGQKRAEAVRRALGLLGVTDSQVEAVSFGKEKPAAAGTGEAALAQNRRAELAYR